MIDEVEVEAPAKEVERLQGHVYIWKQKDKYGFIAVRGHKEPDGKKKLWHFHANSLLMGNSPDAIGVGVVVEFTPLPCPAKDKRDKATEIEVVG